MDQALTFLSSITKIEWLLIIIVYLLIRLIGNISDMSPMLQSVLEEIDGMDVYSKLSDINDKLSCLNEYVDEIYQISPEILVKYVNIHHKVCHVDNAVSNIQENVGRIATLVCNRTDAHN